MWARAWSPLSWLSLGWAGPGRSPDYAPLDETPILDVRPYRAADGTGIHVAWDSTAPPGSWYQLYINGRLVWWGQQTSADVAYSPASGERVYFTVGTVGAAVVDVDFSYLITLPGNRADLSWYGGRYLCPRLKRFRVYSSPGPGLAVSFARALASVEAAPGGLWDDGWGRGRWGAGGWGYSDIHYTWTSPPLVPGTWTFAVTSLDDAGNETAHADAPTVVQVIVGPPGSPPPRADGRRMWIQSYDATTHQFTLAWNPVP
jgi:hypothetical protein